MPNELDRGYFGVRLGDAINIGAGHVTKALENKYMAQRQNKLLEEERARTAPLDALKIQEIMAGLKAHEAETTLKTTQAEALKNKPAQTAPQGFRTVSGGLEPIPGGPADIKIKEQAAKSKDAMETHKVTNDLVLSTIDKAIQGVNWKTSGLVGNVLSGMGGTGAADLEGDLKTIKANLGFDRLTRMRNESKTGGALGNVSDRELALLTSAMANLEQKLSPEKLLSNLYIVKGILSKMNKGISNYNPTSIKVDFTPDKIAEMEASFQRGE